jgi:hypothetical protein
MKPEWVSVISSVFASIGVVFIAFQAYYAKEQIENDHERSRRETTIKLMLNWIENLDIKTASARKLVESLDDKTCEKIYNMKVVKISEDNTAIIKGILDNDKLTAENGFITINEYESSIIRSYVLKYLNSLETILTGWRLGIVDKEIIEEELIYLYNSEKDKCVLHNFRNVAGMHSYPSIKAFCITLNKLYSKEVIATKDNIV